MKILSTVKEDLLNPFPGEINNYISQNTQNIIDSSIYKFWLPDVFDYDIIHIHWIEAFTTSFNLPNVINGDQNIKVELYLLHEALNKWKSKAKIIITIHNERPHLNRNEFTNLVFDLVHKYADGFIHMGKYSYNKFLNHPQLSLKKNYIIPHAVYESYPNTVSKEESRKKYNIPQKAFVILAFSLRNETERDFVLNTFNKVKIPRKFLFSPKWYAGDFYKNGNLIGLIKEKLFEIKSRLYRDKRFMSNKHHLVHNEIQYYLNLCDVVLIPRVDSLNSGVIPLAMAFGKPVIGPNVGNITDVLETINNPSFRPGDFNQAAHILNTNRDIKNWKAIGKRNKDFGSKYWSVKDMAEKHIDVYTDMMAN